MKATKPIEPKISPPSKFAPLNTGIAFFELISRQNGYPVMPVLPSQGTAISKSPLLEAASDANQLLRFAAKLRREKT
jgi:hypothetical protein